MGCPAWCPLSSHFRDLSAARQLLPPGCLTFRTLPQFALARMTLKAVHFFFPHKLCNFKANKKPTKVAHHLNTNPQKVKSGLGHLENPRNIRALIAAYTEIPDTCMTKPPAETAHTHSQPLGAPPQFYLVGKLCPTHSSLN